MEKNTKILIGILSTLLVLGVVGAYVYWDKNGRLALEKRELEQRVNESEYAKTQAQTESRQLTVQLSTASARSDSLAREIAEVSSLIDQQERTLRQLRTTNARLKSSGEEAEAQLAQSHSKEGQLMDQNQALTDQKDQLSNQVATLNQQLLLMVPRQSLTADNFRVAVRKPNDKVTAKAKKTHSLDISFRVPAELGLTGSQEVYVSIADLRNDASLTPIRYATVAGQSRLVPVHAEKTFDFNQTHQTVTLTVESVPEMAPGIYRASVFTKDGYLGSVEFPLRDSFWFF